MADLAQHPTVKPVHLIADALRDVSGRGEIVLDGFGGSGSTLIAAAKTGRRARLCEIDPVYCDTHPRPLGGLCHRRGPRGWTPKGPRPRAARRWRHEPRPPGTRPTPAAPPDRRLRPPARGASLHPRPVRESARPPEGRHVQETRAAARSADADRARRSGSPDPRPGGRSHGLPVDDAGDHPRTVRRRGQGPPRGPRRHVLEMLALSEDEAPRTAEQPRRHL